MGTQETTIYRLVMRNQSYDVYFSILGAVNTRAPNGLGPPDPTKKLANWADILRQPLSRNRAFEIFWGEPHPPLLKVNFSN